MLGGTLGLSGYIAQPSGGVSPGTNDYFPFGPYIAGAGGVSPVVGSFTWTVPGLAGGSGMNTINVNNNYETVGQQYTVDYGTGVITRTNPWIANDFVTGSYKKTS